MESTGRGGPPAGAGGAAGAACLITPEPPVLRRRFRNLVVPALVVTVLAWVALALWGGGREMRRGLLTGGPALMSADGTGHGGHAVHGGHDAVTVAGGTELMPDFGAAAPPAAEAPAHAMTMLGFDMGDLAPTSAGYVGLFLWMWTVMVVAMMLPATLPSVRVFLAGDRNRKHCAGLSFLSGCLLVWAVGGLAVYGLLGVLDLALPADPAAGSRSALGVGAVGLLAAGLFQFSRAKERGLSHVRGPFNCGEGPLRAGLHHGRRCLVSCGPYMLAVALIGMMSLFWMAVFALVMLAEQAAEMLAGRGLLVARTAGAVTVLIAGGLLLSPTPLPLVG